jgi:hypothetical protein
MERMLSSVSNLDVKGKDHVDDLSLGRWKDILKWILKIGCDVMSWIKLIRVGSVDNDCLSVY